MLKLWGGWDREKRVTVMNPYEFMKKMSLLLLELLLLVELVRASKPIIENEAVEGSLVAGSAETFTLSTVIDWKYYVFIATVTLYSMHLRGECIDPTRPVVCRWPQ